MSKVMGEVGDSSGNRIAVTRPNFAGPPPTSSMPDLYRNGQLQPHSPRMVEQKALPTDDPLRPQLIRFFEMWQLQVTSLEQRCPKFCKKGFTVRGTDPAQTSFQVQGERPCSILLWQLSLGLQPPPKSSGLIPPIQPPQSPKQVKGSILITWAHLHTEEEVL